MDKAAPAVQAAKRRMLHFPRALGECSAQVSNYTYSVLLFTIPFCITCAW